MTPEAYLPAHLQGATLEKINAGLSGAGVYKVHAGDASYVLKIADGPIETTIRAAAAEAGVGPKVVYVDPTRHAVVTELVVDRGFAPLMMTPQTRPQALARLGQTLRRVHELPSPEGATPAEPHALLERFAAACAEHGVPERVRTAQQRALAEPAPPLERALAICHNDVNPTNLVWDGERVVLLDWDTAAPNDPLYDLASIAVFMRMDEDTCRALIEAHDGVAPAALPARFAYWRRMVAALCGSAFIALARRGGYTADAAPLTLVELYGRLRTGELSPATGEGQWLFGSALLGESLAL